MDGDLMTLEKTTLKLAIQSCQKSDYSVHVTKLLKMLGYSSSRTLPLELRNTGGISPRFRSG